MMCASFLCMWGFYLADGVWLIPFPRPPLVWLFPLFIDTSPLENSGHVIRTVFRTWPGFFVFFPISRKRSSHDPRRIEDADDPPLRVHCRAGERDRRVVAIEGYQLAASVLLMKDFPSTEKTPTSPKSTTSVLCTSSRSPSRKRGIMLSPWTRTT